MNSNIKRKILHIFFPNRCPVCGEFIDALSSFCDVCSSKIQPYTGRFSIKGASGCTAAFVYNKDISPAVFLLKNGICGNAAYALLEVASGETILASVTQDFAEQQVKIQLSGEDIQVHSLDVEMRIC